MITRGDKIQNPKTRGVGDDLFSFANPENLWEVVGDDLLKTGEDIANKATGTVRSRVTFSLQQLPDTKNLILTGNQPINGTGNQQNNVIIGNNSNNFLSGLQGSDRLSGNGGNDRIDGGLDADFMFGGLGDDIFVVNIAGDRVSEAINQGNDTINSRADFALSQNVENLVLLGNAIVGIGNTLGNTLTGNAASNLLRGLGGSDYLFGNAGDDRLAGGQGNDQLFGSSGNDILVGGQGVDQFIYDTGRAFSRSDVGVDTIADFNVRGANTDLIVLSQKTFGLTLSDPGSGFINAAEFAIVNTNTDAEASAAKIVYSRGSNSLFYNANGTSDGFGSGGRFITFGQRFNDARIDQFSFVIVS